MGKSRCFIGQLPWVILLELDLRLLLQQAILFKVVVLNKDM